MKKNKLKLIFFLVIAMLFTTSIARDSQNRWRVGKLEGASPYNLFY